MLLREIIKALRKKYATAPDAVAVTASTGIAACNIGGVTLHSFGGVGLGIEDTNTLVSKIKKNKKASARWLRTKVLIVDESESLAVHPVRLIWLTCSLHGRRSAVRQALQDRSDDAEIADEALRRYPDHCYRGLLPVASCHEGQLCHALLLRSGDVERDNQHVRQPDQGFPTKGSE